MDVETLIQLFEPFITQDPSAIKEANRKITEYSSNHTGEFIINCCKIIESGRNSAKYIIIALNTINNAINTSKMHSNAIKKIFLEYDEENCNCFINAHLQALLYTDPNIRRIGAENLVYFVAISEDYFLRIFELIKQYFANEDNRLGSNAIFAAIQLFSEMLNYDLINRFILSEGFDEYQMNFVKICEYILNTENHKTYQEMIVVKDFFKLYFMRINSIIELGQEESNVIVQLLGKLDMQSILNTTVKLLSSSNDGSIHKLCYKLLYIIIELFYNLTPDSIDTDLINNFYASSDQDFNVDSDSNICACKFWTKIIRLFQNSPNFINPEIIFKIFGYFKTYLESDTISIDERMNGDHFRVIPAAQLLFKEYSCYPDSKQFAEFLLALFKENYTSEDPRVILASLLSFESLFAIFGISETPNSLDDLTLIASFINSEHPIIRFEAVYILRLICEKNLQDVFDKYENLLEIAANSIRKGYATGLQYDLISGFKLCRAIIKSEFEYNDTSILACHDIIFETIYHILNTDFDALEIELLNDIKKFYRTIISDLINNDKTNSYYDCINHLLDNVEIILPLNERKPAVQCQVLQEFYCNMIEYYIEAHDQHLLPNKARFQGEMIFIIEKLEPQIKCGFDNQNVYVLISKIISALKDSGFEMSNVPEKIYEMLVEYEKRVIDELDFSAILDFIEILHLLINGNPSLLSETAKDFIEKIINIIEDENTSQNIAVACISVLGDLFIINNGPYQEIKDIMEFIEQYTHKTFEVFDKSLLSDVLTGVLNIFTAFIHLFKDQELAFTEYNERSFIRLLYPLNFIRKIENLNYLQPLKKDLVYAVYTFLKYFIDYVLPKGRIRILNNYQVIISGEFKRYSMEITGLEDETLLSYSNDKFEQNKFEVSRR
ncbi:hypothetical protein TVAG_463380 [Trichomonas vaginalis G3]|uniref:Uncharacterized protein n=1 Tax=Trichomonas vaginalis (strain ATCC PRA-98 / G3) TaxID=412133 RepID=A2EH10_TRIV3|nr:armadillo (ARM) repeat-containing protein family [Trichomonas vaginalis G3]EAY08058.1 hypothetical protein TVAG_463380 [Trichomonas vaginalis G3]KAI5543025.1 armadillo (ARM) repeat-containing protein family [Trichomonas vaginalis G3]|eukprot:XP_001320281.1 hypothetical protein [Trichomonas vaginalis G3]